MKKTNGSRSGSVLVAVIVVILAMSGAIGLLATISLQRSEKATQLAYFSRAQGLAEAGVHEAYSLLATNFNARTNATAFPKKNVAGGWYDADIVRTDESVAVIKSVGYYRGAQTEVVLDIGNDTHGVTTNITPHESQDYAILVGGDMVWGGRGLTTILSSKIQINGAFEMVGNTQLDGNLSAVESIAMGNNNDLMGEIHAPMYLDNAPDNITGNYEVMNVPTVPIPDYDLTGWAVEAAKYGQVYEGNLLLNQNGLLAPPGGVIFVNGDLKISGAGDFVGLYIATGTIEISRKGDHIQYQDYPAFMSRDGNIDLASDSAINGMVYAKTGDFEKTGNGSITGNIIVAGDFKKNGEWDKMAWADSNPIPPDVRVDPGSELTYISAWQK